IMIIEKAREVDVSSFDRPEFYEKLENANREAGMRPVGIIQAVFRVASTLISAISFVAVLFTLHPFAPLVVVIAAIPSAILSYYYRQRNFHYIRRHSKERREMSYYSGLMVNKDQVKEIKLLGLGDTFISKYKTVFGKYFGGLRHLIVKEGVSQILVSLLTTLVHGALFAYVAYHVVYSSAQIGDYSLYTGALTSIVTTVSALINVSAAVYEGTLFIDNLITFMKEEPTVVPSIDPPAPVASGVPHTIEFCDVCFAYPGTTRYVLDHVSLTIRPGETAVLVGLNGAGKTTFLKLLTRLYDPTEGKILLDGRDLREYEPTELYRIFGIIFQDFGKYAVSVSDNVRFGDIYREGSAEEIAEAAKKSDAEDFISLLPNGYDTPLMRFFEPDGIELSIGQWQKLAIARAFYSASDILILDEPTASLDPMAEQEIFRQFDELRKDKTTIFVSHRLSSATVASKIIVLEYGKLVEEGTHRELMAKGGKYYELFTTQAKRYLEEK
ncbi:MAG: ABC transporter ATP-binding protein, partial [Clostridia bacterium]|nr:ABC transporter ATP-binding protein [Clostridia bacterium]